MIYKAIKMEVRSVPTLKSLTATHPVAMLLLTKRDISRLLSCAATMRCRSSFEGRFKGKDSMSATCQIFTASFIGMIVPVT